ncbi:helix-turn-helix transcriptional regulator [Mycobacterium sp. AMU20-3851]|uniref:AraC family transcriptional regulator n=1 Tax=Mycobacterium sp. AMU20-3851 TaxID=3122055 RepID=UPI0037552FE5
MGPGRLALIGTFDDAPMTGFKFHQHPVVQVTVGLDGELTVVTGDGRAVTSQVVVIASGTRHTLRSGGARTVLSVYLSPLARAGAALNSVSRGSGVWAAERAVAESITSRVRLVDDVRSAGDAAVCEVLRAGGDNATVGGPVHPAVQNALHVLSASIPGRAGLAAVARAVAVSPDYLGRLFRRHTGASFAATSRWLRLLTALYYLDRGASVTDSAHLAGFADGAHAHRVCMELAGLAPGQVARALAAGRTDLFNPE